MAWTGSFTVFTTSNTEFDITTYDVTYPTDLLPTDDEYDKRGTTETVSESIPRQVEDYTINGAYVNLKNYSLYFEDELNTEGTNWDKSKKQTLAFISYNVYTSSEARLDPEGSPGYTNEIWSVPFDANTESSSLEWAYDHLKAQLGFESMSNSI